MAKNNPLFQKIKKHYNLAPSHQHRRCQFIGNDVDKKMTLEASIDQVESRLTPVNVFIKLLKNSVSPEALELAYFGPLLQTDIFRIFSSHESALDSQKNIRALTDFSPQTSC